MSETSSRLIQGLIIGVGVVISMVILLGILWAYWMFPGNSDWENADEWQEYSSESQLLISNSRRVIRNDELVILGSLENKGKHSWDDISVEVEIFDDEGIFLDECTHLIENTCIPNATENFKMICASCKDIDASSIASHTIRITYASYHWQDDELTGP